jgi:hypothetical protein
MPRGNSLPYLKARLKRDHKAIHGALVRGKYRSVRAAAIAAGIIKARQPGVLAGLQRLWLHAPHDKQQDFLRWLRDRGELQLDPDPQRREELTRKAFESLPPGEQRHLVEEEEQRRRLSGRRPSRKKASRKT